MSEAVAAPAHEYSLLLFDIEGTTTPISFVKEILFPYVLTNLRSYLQRNYAEQQQTRDDVQAVRQLAEEDRASGNAAAPLIPAVPAQGDEAALAALFDAVVANVAWQMSSDRKSTALKQLQGHMWKDGYVSGELKGQLFGGASGDVATQLHAWHAAQYRLGVYSSGSVAAQQLLFRHSDAGDLTPLFSCYFDTLVGMKQQSSSYANIAAQVALAEQPQRILFFTDIWQEAQAAKQAGVNAVLLDRPGNYALPAEQSSVYSFPLATSFAQVDQWIQEKPRGQGPLHKLAQDTAAAAQAAKEAAARNAPAVDTSKGQFNTF